MHFFSIDDDTMFSVDLILLLNFNFHLIPRFTYHFSIIFTYYHDIDSFKTITTIMRYLWKYQVILEYHI